MKRNASLLLLELVIMLLVFALAAALCLQAFSWADSQSQQSAAEDMALLQAQNAAEMLKSCHGDFDLAAERFGGKRSEQWMVGYDENWNITEADPTYRLQVMSASEGLLGRGELTVIDKNGQILAQLTVCWQEVAP